MMYKCSTPTPSPTGIRHPSPATESTRGKRNEHTHRGYSKWSIRPSLHLFFQPHAGGIGREATCFYKCHGFYMLALKWDHSYSTTLCWLRCRLTFSPICSAIQSLRRARSSQHHVVHSPPTGCRIQATFHFYKYELPIYKYKLSIYKHKLSIYKYRTQMGGNWFVQFVPSRLKTKQCDKQICIVSNSNT